MRESKGKRKFIKMNSLRQIIFTLVAVVVLSLAVSAQKNDPKKPPPKPKPPVINPGDKKPPKNEDKPKKPEMSFVLVYKEGSADLV